MAVQAECMHRGDQSDIGGTLGARRTENMKVMSLTLDVSKLSGWLNALASCRVTRPRLVCRPNAERARWEVGSRWRCMQGAGRSQLDIGGETRAERTQNMLPMSVTLDVSKLSGWLNPLLLCPAAQGGA